MSDERSKKGDPEYKLGEMDGRAGRPPAALVGAYMEGYVAGKAAVHRLLTPSGVEKAREVPEYVVEHLKEYLIDPESVLRRPADHWGGRSAVEYVESGASWDEVLRVFDRLFKREPTG